MFYEGGKTVTIPEHVVGQTLDEVAAVIAREDPDVVFLQEVDRGSQRHVTEVWVLPAYSK